MQLCVFYVGCVGALAKCFSIWFFKRKRFVSLPEEGVSLSKIDWCRYRCVEKLRRILVEEFFYLQLLFFLIARKSFCQQNMMNFIKRQVNKRFDTGILDIFSMQKTGYWGKRGCDFTKADFREISHLLRLCAQPGRHSRHQISVLVLSKEGYYSVILLGVLIALPHLFLSCRTCTWILARSDRTSKPWWQSFNRTWKATSVWNPSLTWRWRRQVHLKLKSSMFYSRDKPTSS